MGKKQSAKTPLVAWKGFVACELNAERKRQFRENWSVRESLGEMVAAAVTPGYKLSFSIDTYHDCCQVSWYCTAADDQNAGWCLTARGGDFETAMAVLTFKHSVLLEGDWTSAAPMDSSEDYLG